MPSPPKKPFSYDTGLEIIVDALKLRTILLLSEHGGSIVPCPRYIDLLRAPAHIDLQPPPQPLVLEVSQLEGPVLQFAPRVRRLNHQRLIGALPGKANHGYDVGAVASESMPTSQLPEDRSPYANSS